jgi:hypothetical protein
MRRRLPLDRVGTPRSAGITSPLCGTPEIHLSVTAWGEYHDDVDGHNHPFRVIIDRVATSDGLRPQIAVEIEDDSGKDVAPDAAPMLDPHDYATPGRIAFASETAFRAYVSALVAAGTAAERQGIIGASERSEAAC